MSRTITKLFDNYSDAKAALAALEQRGVPHSDISIVASNADGAHDTSGAHRLRPRRKPGGQRCGAPDLGASAKESASVDCGSCRVVGVAVHTAICGG
jgi:hypothetical protein